MERPGIPERRETNKANPINVPVYFLEAISSPQGRKDELKWGLVAIQIFRFKKTDFRAWEAKVTGICESEKKKKRERERKQKKKKKKLYT